jgi:hypothetical protein
LSINPNIDTIPERPICEDLGIKLIDSLGDKFSILHDCDPMDAIPKSRLRITKKQLKNRIIFNGGKPLLS